MLQLDELILQRLLVQDGSLRGAGVLPGGDVGVLVIVTQGLAVLGLALRTEVPATGLAAVQGVDAHQFAEFHEVGHAAGALE